MNTKILIETMTELMPQVGAWSDRNFPSSDSPDFPAMGVYEEFGEFSHSRLKRLQGIRGTREEHAAGELDGLCDMLIYLMDHARRLPDYYWTTIAKDTLDVDQTIGDCIKEEIQANPDYLNLYACRLHHLMAKAIGNFGESCDGMLADNHQMWYANGAYAIPVLILAASEYVDVVHDVDLSDELRKTWSRVSQRDWVANPVDAHAVVAAADMRV